MIKFKEDATLVIIEGYDEENDNITEDYEAHFKKGEIVDADICSMNDEENSKYVDLQFGYHGGLATCVQRNCFEVIR